MKTVTIDWIGTHHPGDGIHQIQSELEAGLDEGPLLVVSCTSGRRRNGSGTYVFRYVMDYLDHLSTYGSELTDDRWVGLVRGRRAEDEGIAVAALNHISSAISPPSRFQPRRGPRGSGKQVTFDHAVLPEPYGPFLQYAIRSKGDGAADFARAFPKARDLLNLVEDEWE